MPKVIDRSGRKIVLAVRRFCELEKSIKTPLIPFDNVRQRVAALTGISEKTVSNITKEAKVAASISQKKTTQVKRNQQKKIQKVAASTSQRKTTIRIKCNQLKKIQVNNSDLCAIRNKIHSMYTERKEVPTLGKLLAELKTDINFDGSQTTLWKIIRKLGFHLKRCGKNKLLMERHNIVAWRQTYLEVLRQNRISMARPVVFLHETYIDTSSTGERWIVIHAGDEMGFMQNAKLIFKSQSKSGIYHANVNKTIVMKWIQEKFIPNLPSNSLIVMDNAAYHNVVVNKAPSKDSPKVDMQNWITSKGLSYLPTMVKAELYEIIKEHKGAPIYEADQLLEAHGHKIARLPPYHSDLNALEFMWSLVKNRVDNNNLGQDTTNIIKLTKDAFQSITAVDWQKQCELVRHIEDRYYETDRFMDAVTDKFTEALNDESDTESDHSELLEDSGSSDSDLYVLLIN